MRTTAGFSLLVLTSILISAGHASAQGFGIGPRMSLVRGDVPSGTPSARFFGGTIRMQSSKRVVLEVAADYRTEMLADGVIRERQRPIQGSVLLFLARTAFSPYVLGGYGLYQRKVEVLDSIGNVVSSISDKETGAHMGIGAELFVSRHAALFADYRYRFVRFGEAEEGSKPIDIPFVDQAKLSHRGTMWTSGVAFYF
jgi:hypothetical protein